MAFMFDPPRSRDDFNIAVFCALPKEADEVQSIFDIDWRLRGVSFGKASDDPNTYSLGSIGKHNVVLVHLGRIGVQTANRAASTIDRSFGNIKLAFVVGICGVVPMHKKSEILLGDCIISTAVIMYDFGSQYPEGFVRKDSIEDSLGPAGHKISSFLAMLKGPTNHQYLTQRLVQNLTQHRKGPLGTTYPGPQEDRLFESSYIHSHAAGRLCNECVQDVGVCTEGCKKIGCDDSQVCRKQNAVHQPRIHFGRVGSANTVMKSGLHRDKIAKKDELLAFEMEGSGVWEYYPTIVLKAGCDYADSHKNQDWQQYAAGVAACTLKALLYLLEKEDTVPRQPAPPSTSVTSLSTFAGHSSGSGPSSGSGRHSSDIPVELEGGTVDRNVSRLNLAAEDPFVSKLTPLRNFGPSTQRIDELIYVLEHNGLLLREGVEYWSHMTIEGFNAYQGLYYAMREDGVKMNLVHFATAIGYHLPEPSETIAKWRRFGIDPAEALPEPYMLALLYMLHIEHFSTRFSAKRPRIDNDLLQILLSFHVWVKCPCQRCKLEWNFASTNWGMHRGPKPGLGVHCLLYRRFVEKEKHRLDPPGSRYTSPRSLQEREDSDKMREQCYRAWLSLGSNPAMGAVVSHV